MPFTLANAVTLALIATGSTFASSVLYAGRRAVGQSMPDACTSAPQLSCQNTTTATNTCCTPTPGGLLVHTQFWDTYTGLESEGQILPKNNWTIHGLWPDNCDGTFESYCDFSRQYDERPSPATINGKKVPPYSGPSVDTFITDGSSNAHFWAHEFSKHGTCFSTFDKKCYSDYKEHEDVINFFDTVSRTFLKYPTYTWLEQAQIVPSNSTTYKLSDIEAALREGSGATPYLGCKGKRLSEVWYYSHAKGQVQDVDFVPVETITKSKCPNDGIQYPQRTQGSEEA
ncbi:ribonuclease T2-like [Serendipita sp. 399]|nr:ribonuclease T2-like [Serendipita sp. 399]